MLIDHTKTARGLLAMVFLNGAHRAYRFLKAEQGVRHAFVKTVAPSKTL